MTIVGLVFLGIIVLFILFLVGIYNSLVTLRNRFKNAFVTNRRAAQAPL